VASGPLNDEPVVEHLAEVWTSLTNACESLDDRQWDLPTDCPGWSVKDQLSHLIGVERMLLGEPSPPAPAPMPDHVRNSIGELNEAWIAARRPARGDEVLAEFVETTGERLASLRALSPAEFDVVGPSPLGQVPYREFMETRVIDSWAHEQDVRRALGRPGGRNGPGEATSLARCFRAMPFVVGKRVAPPDGTTVRFDVAGELGREELVGMDGARASVLTAVPPGPPTVALSMDQDTFWRLGFGRTGSDQALATGSVTVAGDLALGRRVLDGMAFMI
jgi:uncharacterized protein (TIGR03083 family)